MDKLELKHLAPYLPYDLPVKINDFSGLNGMKIRALYRLKDCAYLVGNVGMDITLDLDRFKPILRPLDDLGKDFIISNGKKVNLMIILEVGLIRIEHLINQLSYFQMQLLFEWHFDVFGLIEKGLAIDINTL